MINDLIEIISQNCGVMIFLGWEIIIEKESLLLLWKEN